MQWEAWLLAARSRAEEAVRGRISSARKSLRRAYGELERRLRRLEEELEKARALLEGEGGPEETKHELAEEVEALRASLAEAIRRGAGLIGEAVNALRAMEEKRMRIEALAEEARREAAVGSLDKAHELAVEVERRKNDMLAELSRLSGALDREAGNVAGLRGRLEELVRRVRRELEMAEEAGIELGGGERLRLARACRARGLGKGILVITNERVVFSPCSGDEVLEARRERVRATGASRWLLRVRRKLVLSFPGPPGRGKLVLYCNRDDEKDILAELARGGEEGP